jgi:hypothetical protein
MSIITSHCPARRIGHKTSFLRLRGRLVRLNHAPDNNKMQRTRSGHSRWRPSLLILVFAGLREHPVHRRVAAVSLAVLMVRCASHSMPAAPPPTPVPTTQLHTYVDGPARLRFRSGSYVVAAGCKARCVSIGDEWHGEVNCPDASIGLTAPSGSPSYDEATHMVLTSGLEMSSGTTSRRGLRLFCATVLAPQGAETACTEVATQAARAQVIGLARSFRTPVRGSAIECIHVKGM